MWFFELMLFLFRPFQLKGVKRKLFVVNFLMFILDTLYSCSSSTRNIKFLRDQHTKDSTQRSLSFQHSFADLHLNDSLLHRLNKAETGFLFPNVYTNLFVFLSSHHHSVLYLSSVQQTKQRRQTANRTLCSSHWNRSESDLANLC